MVQKKAYADDEKREIPFGGIMSLRPDNCKRTTKRRTFRMNDKNSLTHKLELQISYYIYIKIQKESIFRRKKGSNQRNTEDIMPVEGCRDYRGGGMPRSHPFTSKYSTQNECIGIYWVSKRKK